MRPEINEQELRKALSVLKPAGALFEIRMLAARKTTFSGYFTDADTAIEALNKFADLRGVNIFITLNKIDEACYDREQHCRFVRSPQNTTQDSEVLSYDWLLIDLDPVRATGTSSTDEQLEMSKQLAGRVTKYLKSAGWEDPVVAMSGNGYHLLYAIGLQNTEENIGLVHRCLASLDLLFSDDNVKVDTANYNPSRICKLYGTLAQKGTGTDKRPHRISYIVKYPETLKQTSRAYLEKLTEALPKEQKAERYNNYNPKSFDVEEWMHKHGIRYREAKTHDYIKFVLEECPFNHDHRDPDSMITVGASGAIGFKCFHNSCQGKTWQDVRKLFEPDAYDRRSTDDDIRIDEGWALHKKYNRDQRLPIYDVPDHDLEEISDEDEHPGFLTARQIFNKPIETEVFIRTGITELDSRLRGLKKGAVSLVSGLRGGSKSTLLSQIALTAVEDGYNVLCYSGELTDKNFARWLTLQAAGKQHTVEDQRYPGYYKVTMDVKDRIASWLGDHLMIYDNDMSQKFDDIMALLRKNIVSQMTDLIMLDNLMTMDIRDLDPRDKYEAQSIFASQLSDLAKKTNTHIMYVAHPRKVSGLLRLNDVSGTMDLVNKTDYAFIVHRNNRDFRTLSADMFHFKADNPMYAGTNVIEVAKDRDGGTQDLFIPLWYEKESKRLKNYAAETWEYSWHNAEQDEGEDYIP